MAAQLWMDGHYKLLWGGKEMHFFATVNANECKVSDLNGTYSNEYEISLGEFEHPDKRGLEITKENHYNVQRIHSTTKDVTDCAVVSKDGKLWTFMNGNQLIWLDEEAFQQVKNNTDPADNMPNDYESRPPGKIVWITGGTGMGKTTTANYMKEKAGFVLYEGDCFLFGLNPYVGSAPQGTSYFGTRRLRGISEERKEVCNKALEGYKMLLSGHQAPAIIWENVYTMMCDEINAERAKIGGNWVVNQAVYTREARDFIRSRLGSQTKFVFLDMDPELQAMRLASRENGTGQISEEALETKKQECLRRTQGYQRKQEDEPSSIQINITETMTTETIAHTIINCIE